MCDFYIVLQLAVMSAFLGPDQLVTESSLASDPEVLPWVQKYQRSRETVSQTDYEVRVIFAAFPASYVKEINSIVNRREVGPPKSVLTIKFVLWKTIAKEHYISVKYAPNTIPCRILLKLI